MNFALPRKPNSKATYKEGVQAKVYYKKPGKEDVATKVVVEFPKR